ncbi:zinc finger protein 252 [Drosophila madeirensis]|uniref:Zinc finger protein 252 n=1 Tax=Drosophila madeirensis TaxID=30013 RepID=A0AAU9FC44_DROMD
MSKPAVRSRRMGFKLAMLQRNYEMSPSPASTSPTNANSFNSTTTNNTTNECPPVGVQAPAQVTDFSISRILGKEERKSPTDATTNILDLSKSATCPPQASAQVPPTIAASPYMGYSMLPPDLVAMANATKFYAQFFPHMLPAYAAAAAAAGLSTPPTSPYQQQQQQHLQKRYFAPYVINGQASPQPQPQPQLNPNLIRPKATACTRTDCLECLTYYQKLQDGYKHPPLASPAASSFSSSSSSSAVRLPVRNLSNTSSTNISLTTVTNFSMNMAQAASGLMPKMNAVGMGGNISSRRHSSINPINPYNPTAAEEISYKCRICEKVFGCSETLQAHEKTHKSPRYECSDCGKGFSQLRNYKYHLSVHRGTKEFAAECPECGKTFNDKGYLSSHMKIHRNRKEYECPYCPKSFNQRVAFNMHVRIHTGVKPHKCAECGKRFSRKMLLKQHMRTHSGEKPYQCSVCGKSFADRSNMTLHHRLHSGIKPFSCPLCPKAFTKKHHLKTHLNYHTGCKPYVCPHPNCNQAFTQSSNMRTHAKKCQYRPLDSTAPPSFTRPVKKLPLGGQMQLQVPTSLALAMAAAPTFAMPPPPPLDQQSLLSNLRTF